MSSFLDYHCSVSLYTIFPANLHLHVSSVSLALFSLIFWNNYSLFSYDNHTFNSILSDLVIFLFKVYISAMNFTQYCCRNAILDLPQWFQLLPICRDISQTFIPGAFISNRAVHFAMETPLGVPRVLKIHHLSFPSKPRISYHD